MDDLISRSDAIGAVKEERFPIDSDYAEGFMAALDKVEWILKEWLPSAQPDSKETSYTHKALDTISRQAAMEEISKQQTYKMFEGEDTLYLDANDVGSVLAGLPSAQPEPCEDTISRQAVLDALQKHFNPTGAELSPDLASVLAGVGVVINTMPSSPSRPHGHWIRVPVANGLDKYRCDQCGHYRTSGEDKNFCPNCGADMRQPEDDIPMEYFESGGAV